MSSAGASRVMLLVEYSDSESSGTEGPRASPALTDSKATSNSHKPAFRKVVDRANPHKIRVNLPKTTKTEGEVGSEPPSKRAKVASNAFSGFNSLLPAPKKAPVLNGGSGAKRAGLGIGVNLKTGATPGFSRDERARMDVSGGDKATIEAEPSNSSTALHDGHNTAFKSQQEPVVTNKVNGEPKIQGNPMMFKPLSVARKQKNTSSSAGTQNIPNQAPVAARQSKTSPMISLFSTGEVQESQNQGPVTTGEYQPMIYLPPNSKPDPSPPFLHDMEDSKSLDIPSNLSAQTNNNQEASTQSLDTIASDLNLSASAKRQLLGRQRNNPSNINIVNFNTDQEYAANEILRQAGEQVQHNPVRAIAPGKHSLKQLVNAATNQKEALEEHFALGRRNRKEAGGKYGWGPG